jgi:hypothetical protein
VYCVCTQAIALNRTSSAPFGQVAVLRGLHLSTLQDDMQHVDIDAIAQQAMLAKLTHKDPTLVQFIRPHFFLFG